MITPTLSNCSGLVDCGDFVVAINARDLAISDDQKRILRFITYSGYRGSQRIIPLGDFHRTNCTEVVYLYCV